MIQNNVYDRYLAAIPELKQVLGFSNSHALPSLEKIVVSMGLGSCLGDRKKIEEAASQLSMICGQKAIITKAKNSVSGLTILMVQEHTLCCKRKARLVCALCKDG